MRNVWRLLALVVCALGPAGHISGQEARPAQAVEMELTKSFHLERIGRLEVFTQSLAGRREMTLLWTPPDAAMANGDSGRYCCCWSINDEGLPVGTCAVLDCWTQACCKEWQRNTCPMPPPTPTPTP